MTPLRSRTRLDTAVSVVYLSDIPILGAMMAADFLLPHPLGRLVAAGLAAVMVSFGAVLVTNFRRCTDVARVRHRTFRPWGSSSLTIWRCWGVFGAGFAVLLLVWIWPGG